MLGFGRRRYITLAHCKAERKCQSVHWVTFNLFLISAIPSRQWPTVESWVLMGQKLKLLWMADGWLTKADSTGFCRITTKTELKDYKNIQKPSKTCTFPTPPLPLPGALVLEVSLAWHLQNLPKLQTPRSRPSRPHPAVGPNICDPRLSRATSATHRSSMFLLVFRGWQKMQKVGKREKRGVWIVWTETCWNHPKSPILRSRSMLGILQLDCLRQQLDCL